MLYIVKEYYYLLILSHLCFADLRFHDIDHFGPGDRDPSTMGIVPIVTPAEGKQLLLTRVYLIASNLNYSREY